jgi:hypothetical protein
VRLASRSSRNAPTFVGVRFDAADARHYVEVDVLPVLPDRGALPAVRFDALDPALGGLGHRLALGRRDVDALADVDLDGRVVRVGILPAVERPDVALAVLIVFW